MLDKSVFETADFLVHGPKGHAHRVLPWIGRFEALIGLQCLVQISRNVAIVGRANSESLHFTAPVPQFKSLREAFIMRLALSHISFGCVEQEISHRKVRIEFYRALKK